VDAHENAPVSQPGLGHGQVQGECRAVFSQPHHFAADADDLLLPRGQVARQIPIVLFPVGRRHEQGDVLADQLLGRIAEHPLGGGVDQLDDAPLVDADDGIDRGFQESAQPGVAGRQRVLDLLAGAVAVR